MTRYSTLFVFVTMLYMSACLTPAEVNFDEVEQELVVYAHFGATEPLQIYLSHTRDPLKPNEPFEPVENAKILVYQDDNLIDTYHRIPGKKEEYSALYEIEEVIGVNGSEYRIEIEVEGYKSVRATQTIPHDNAEVSSFKEWERPEEAEGNKVFELLFSDDNSTENYYQLVVKLVEYSREGELLTEEMVDYELVSPLGFTHFEPESGKEWTAIYPEYVGFLFTGVHQVGDSKELYLEMPDRETDFSPENTYAYRAELYNVSDAYFLYHQSVQSQFTNENSLNEPVRIYNNIEGGFGNFSTYNMGFAETTAINE